MKKNLVLNNKTLARSLVIGALLLSCQNFASDLSVADLALRTQDFKRAFSLYLEAAKSGNPEAQYRVANLYILGEGTRKNEAQAILYLERAAAQHYASAEFQLGIRLKDSQPERSQNLIKSAANQGYSAARKHLKFDTSEQSHDSSVERWFSAARKANIRVLKKILDSDQHIDIKDSAGQTALFYAIHSQSQDTVSWLLKQGANPNHVDNQGLTPLLIAVDNGKRDTINSLIQAGANTHALSSTGNSLLHLAINRGHRSLVPLLIQVNVQTDTLSNNGRSAADLAQQRGWKKETQALLLAGSPLTRKSDSSKGLQEKVEQWKKIYNDDPLAGLSVLITGSDKELLNHIFPSVFRNSLKEPGDRTKLLELAILSQNADALSLLKDESMSFNDTHLLAIAKTSCVDCAEILLSSGLSPIKGPVSDDAISTAINERKAIMATYLYRKVKDQIPAQKRVGMYLIYAARAELNKLALSFLPEADAAKDERKRDAYAYAAINGDSTLIRALKAREFPLDNKDKSHRTAFFLAIENGNLECAKLLLTKDSLNQPTKSGLTSLMIASFNKDLNAVKWLLNQSADVSFRNARGDTALIYAAKAEATEVARLLLQAGANRLVKNENGMRAGDFVTDQSELKKLL